MNWLSTIITAIVTAVAGVLTRRDTTPAPPPMPPPPAPGFDAIERDEDARLAKLVEQERTSVQPVMVPPPLPSADDADDPYEDVEPEPSTRSP